MKMRVIVCVVLIGLLFVTSVDGRRSMDCSETELNMEYKVV